VSHRHLTNANLHNPASATRRPSREAILPNVPLHNVIAMAEAARG